MALIVCKECGKEYSDSVASCPNCGCPNPVSGQLGIKPTKGIWSTGRLVIGILSIVLCMVISFQSCAAGMSNALQNNDAVSGSQGIILAVMMLIGGIVGICTRNSKSKIGTMCPAIFYWLGALMTAGSGDTYGDLPIWGFLSFIFGVVFIVSGFKMKSQS